MKTTTTRAERTKLSDSEKQNRAVNAESEGGERKKERGGGWERVREAARQRKRESAGLVFH